VPDFTIALERLEGAIELGAEGTATAPTRILYSGPPGGIDPSGLIKPETITDRRAAGTRTSLRATYSGIEMNTLSLSSVPVSYQDFGWWLSLLAPTGAGVPGTVDGTSFERTFTPVEGTAVNSFGVGFYSANLEYTSMDFESTLTYQLPAMRVSNFTVNFDKRASGTDTGVMFDVELMMAQGTATQGTALTSALSHTTPTLAIGNQLTAYIDAASTAIGTTADDQVMAASFNLVNPLTWHDGMDGTNGHTSAHYAQQWTPTMTLTRRFSDTTELAAYVAKTTRAVRIEAVGDVVGATTATNIVRLDMICSPTDHRATQVDGLWYAEIDYEGIYDSTLTTSWEFYTRSASSAAYTAT
jgi:hypothetical protein